MGYTQRIPMFHRRACVLSGTAVAFLIFTVMLSKRPNSCDNGKNAQGMMEQDRFSSIGDDSVQKGHVGGNEEERSDTTKTAALTAATTTSEKQKEENAPNDNIHSSDEQEKALHSDDSKDVKKQVKDAGKSQEIAYYEVKTCPELRLAYHHIYKNAGTSMMNELGKFCTKVTGKGGGFLKSWIPKERTSSFREFCSKNFCYTFWREPVDRFLSAYHELMKRTGDGTNAWPDGWQVATTHEGLVPLIEAKLGLPEDASDEVKMRNFIEFWNLVETGILKDAHVQPQVHFLLGEGSSSLNMSDFAFFDMRRAEDLLPMIFCGAYAWNGHEGSCPYAAKKVQHDRNRFSEHYGRPQYMIKEEELSDAIIERIVKFYCKDYCHFGIPVHKRVSWIDTTQCC